ncbi:MAG: hypothetical protein M1370_02770 [Bacteroidetes bacterium]|nr:hypothetical protein [Bacteroidota bacterium]
MEDLQELDVAAVVVLGLMLRFGIPAVLLFGLGHWLERTGRLGRTGRLYPGHDTWAGRS